MSTSSTERAWLAVAVLVASVAGCNLVLGLDATHPDSDRDGIGDRSDNCPTVANPDQLDSNPDDPGGDACAVCTRASRGDLDGDGYDDACDACLGPGPTGVDSDGDGLDDGCDPCIAGVSRFAVDLDHDGIADGCEICPGVELTTDVDHDGLDDSCDDCLRGPPHDEDHDGISDACDPCPGDDGPPGDLDADGIGDACDPTKTPDVRRMFDPFLVNRSDYWAMIQPGWSIDHDTVRVTALTTTASRSTSVMIGSDFEVSTHLRFEVADTDGNVTLGLEGSGPVLAVRTCTLYADGAFGLSIGTGGRGPLTVDVSGGVTLRLRFRPTSPTTYQLACDAIDAAGRVTTSTLAELSARTWAIDLLAAQVIARFDYLDVVSGAP